MARKKKKDEAAVEGIEEGNTEVAEVIETPVAEEAPAVVAEVMEEETDVIEEEKVEVIEEVLVEEKTEVIEAPVVEEAPAVVEVVEEVKVSPYPSIDESFGNYLSSLKSNNSIVAIKHLSALFHNLAVKGDEKQLDYVLALMREHKKYTLDFTKALGSIQTLNKNVKSKVEIMFIIFNKIINNTANQISYDVVRKETGNEKLIAWMNRRVKR